MDTGLSEVIILVGKFAFCILVQDAGSAALDIFRIQEVLVSGCCSVFSGYFLFCIDHVVFQSGQVLDPFLSGVCSGCIGYHAVFVEVVCDFSGFLLLDALSLSIVQVFLCQADRLVARCTLLRYSCRT